ncbi:MULTISPECIES: ectoine/hydroxyectoine ABC transporter permease subunit EhuC [unclassified Isoptericola]|uniref:ectoine/hydroxyectoine ABC transporter permease subunit EhuC n=1 Tax=unclassified Isoptericola TaxID=2623355 RepID=UPI002713C4E5|nr:MULTISPECIES: ectoine/hydroxyectoine ABC transporter permease subunit EhuC [unclassified Isoptericola]MDO8143973.1 ectoine/hydroxyectoine ABC transporter permease subunit EhuC [Isoptericola sp. 178]MDO8149388.1 ectoine/hydroxyectoine ABC transporter permease subunit EhuC [Isoptericola sp. b515]MDO8152335.1 ectoine/hydroxyectoine ABC transporter permease subunit EhuC [Isoptericola sp. b408]
MSDDIQELVERLPLLGDAVLVTLQMTLGGALLAIVIAVLLGFGSRTRSLWVRGPSRVVVEFFRGTSLVVQLFWLFYVLPVFGFKMEALAVAVVALGLNYGAYASEVVRGSIASVPPGQWEAATALNMTWFHKVRRVIFPQAWALMIPMLANLLIQLVKGSALAYYITLQDVNFWTVELRRATADTFFSYTAGLLVYFIIAYLLTWGMNILEERAKRRLGRGTRPSLRETLGLKPRGLYTPKVPEPTGGAR